MTKSEQYFTGVGDYFSRPADIVLANGNVQSISGGNVWWKWINKERTNYGIIGCYFAIKTTQARNNLPWCRFEITDHENQRYVITFSMPYVLTMTTNINGGARYMSSTDSSKNYFYACPLNLAANSSVTSYGFGFGYANPL